MDASSDDDDDNDDEYEAESEEGKDSEMRVVFDTIEEAENTLAGTPFDLFASTTVIKSGLLHSSSDPTIRPLKDCLARARWECRSNRNCLSARATRFAIST